MVLENDKSHRSGIWKQQNKAHKTGRHRSKGQIDVENKGRVSVKTITRHLKKDERKVNKRHHALQMRNKKRDEILQQKRNVGGRDAPPHLVAIIPLHRNTDVEKIVEKIKSMGDEDGSVHHSSLPSGGFTVNIPRLKHRFTIIKPASPELTEMLDCGLVADTVVFVLALDQEEPIDYKGQTFISTLFAQGLSASVLATCGLNSVPIKKRTDVKRGMQKTLAKVFPDSKIHSLDTEQDVQITMRHIAEQKRRTISLRHRRPYLLADKFHFECDENSETGTLAVSGFVRGECLDVNRLVHIVGWGDYQVNRVDSCDDPCRPVKLRKNGKNKEEAMVTDDANNNVPVEMANQETLVTFDPDKRQDMVREAEVDPLDAEQTWPTEEEMREAEEAIHEKKKMVKKVPKGTSEYQAAWILDSDEEWQEKEEEDSDEDMEEDDLQPIQADEESQVDSEEEMERVRVSESSQLTSENQYETASQYDEGMDVEEETEALKRYREERSHQMFPDEIDTPHDVPARIRFQKYRGLSSFRTSPWDVKENLPLDYARIFQFQNFDRTRRRIRALEVDDSVKSGMYVTLYLENVAKSSVENHPPLSPIILYGLFPHEQKMSVVHLALKRIPGAYDDLTLKSKDEMLFHVGFRRFRARPTYSQHTSGDKHKMERYFPKEGVAVASMYAQIMLPPANVLMFKESSSGVIPVASGSLYKVDPDRVVTKRIVLSGHPFRIHKRLATIRYMFFNPDDVAWFKPIELRTKWGRRGHIKEALGTHGHMKCTFDSQLTSQDTVLMNLYKRVFPKWSYTPITPSNKVKTQTDESETSSVIKSREVHFDDEFFD